MRGMAGAGLCALVLTALVAGGCGSDDGSDKADTASKTEAKKPRRSYQANINGCEIKPKTDCEGVDMTGADLTNAPLTGAQLRNATLVKAVAEGAVFNDGHLGQAHLQGADLSGAKFRGADLVAAQFDERTDLTGADLYVTSLENSTGLTDHQLNRAILCGTFPPKGGAQRNDDCRRDPPSEINGCVLKPGTSCPDANLKGADLHDIDLHGSHLKGIVLTGANLRSANFKGADMDGAKLDGAKFCHTTLPDGTVRVDGCN